MSSGICLADDCPEQYRDVIDIVDAEETTIVDTGLTGKLEQEDLDMFLDNVFVADHEVDPGLIHLVEIVDTLLEKSDS
ncbi:hypothetical protein [Halorubrum sp. N11]|uniref:hypothetical protein n=1 Tax=Halorubrum sp. N11 TaxID=3402276 RepID=UPI003EB766A4